MTTHPSSLQFPCEFLFKIFGKATDEFEIAVLSIIRKHTDELKENAIRCRPSKDGNYMALTITILAQSQEQLDNIYRELSSNPLVLMVL